MRILVSNDDGVLAPGLAALADALATLGEVTVVAPESERSGFSNALSLDRPLRPVRQANGYWAVNGTPADCVHLALNGLLDFEPDLVVSGINSGANLGDDTLYSGTVAAAMEARFLGKTSIAVSLAGPGARNCGKDGYAAAAATVVRLIEGWDRLQLPNRTLLNVNVPERPLQDIRGFKVTRLGHRGRAKDVMTLEDPRGREVYWIGIAGEPADAGEDTDFHAVHEGYVSVTPLQVDLTRHEALQDVSRWLKDL
ncbi:MAG: stationary phase survival protein SurE [Moraxellaceae bacterium]|jgi:5'-nucleotidase|nr:stationary phase survival protein SurE [Moraxellaceae bacterium]